jgi:uncharacterized membrane protein YedE/YeeE
VDLATSIAWALAGGALIGAASAALLALDGQIAGISGILGGLLAPARGDVAWRALFALGLLAGGLAAYLVAPAAFEPSGSSDVARLAIAGVLVGVGARLGSGCTSGHGICGISRVSPRSIAATVTFMATGFFTVGAMRSLGWLS